MSRGLSALNSLLRRLAPRRCPLCATSALHIRFCASFCIFLIPLTMMSCRRALLLLERKVACAAFPLVLKAVMGDSGPRREANASALCNDHHAKGSFQDSHTLLSLKKPPKYHFRFSQCWSRTRQKNAFQGILTDPTFVPRTPSAMQTYAPSGEVSLDVRHRRFQRGFEGV